VSTLWQHVFGHTPHWRVALPALAIALSIAWAVTQFGVSIVRRSFRWTAGTHTAPFRSLLWAVRSVLLAVLTIVFVPPVFELFGEPLRAGLKLGTLTSWTLNNGLRVVLIVVLAYLVMRLVTFATTRFERQMSGSDGPLAFEQAQRSRTLGAMIRNVASAVIIATAGVMVLDQLGINTTPLLASAGIVGLAVGFGAQTLVKDIIGGFFLILENQVRVGDVAKINGTGGLVEAITLRTVVLRDVRGSVHVFPCGSVNTLANLTREYAFAVVDVQVDYQHDTDEVITVLRAIGAEVQQDPALVSSIRAPLEILAIENLGDTAVTIRIRMKADPQRQWDVARALRRAVKKHFELRGIVIPTAQPLTVVAKPTPPTQSTPSTPR
jgi:small-conductance mechanosensitive channel